MPFGSQSTQQDAGGAGADRYEARTLTITGGDPKETAAGKTYWRVKDTSGKWYSVWSASIKDILEVAADNQLPTPCAVQIQNKGDKTFYSIVAAGPDAESVVREKQAGAAQSVQPGGRNSPYAKPYDPETQRRVTRLALLERSLHMVNLTIADKPDEATYEQYVKGKLIDYMTFLGGILKHGADRPEEQEQAPPPAEEPPADPDDDIGF